MREFSISVKIADRSYRLMINEEEEPLVREAASVINERIGEYSEQYAFNDRQDLVAMSALYFATRSLRSEDENRKMKDNLLKRISVLDQEITSQL